MINRRVNGYLGLGSEASTSQCFDLPFNWLLEHVPENRYRHLYTVIAVTNDKIIVRLFYNYHT